VFLSDLAAHAIGRYLQYVRIPRRPILLLRAGICQATASRDSRDRLSWRSFPKLSLTCRTARL
jgi:hypothetical protein